MRIDPNNSIKPHLSRQQPQATAQRSKHVSGDASASLSSVDVKSIDNLLQMIASSSEIRESVVNDVKAKIQTGEYLSKAAAYEAASAILNL